ncbi:hypothetical protein LUR56_18745 [Streptomyces sp. MT29]|nr:hypothetical protein [Streptomyces sp. MT29]
MAALRTTSGLITTVRILKQPGRPSVEDVAQRLERGTPTGRPYDAEALRLRIPMGMEGRAADAPPPDPVSAWRPAGPLLAGLGVATACGFATAVLHGFQLLVPLIIVCGPIRPVGRQLTDRRQDRPPIVVVAWGTASVVGCAALGLVLALAAPGPPGQASRILAYAVGGGSALAFVLYGLGYALVHSWFSRNANWAVPALVPALALTLPWFGGLLHTMYLQAGFGLPSDAIHVSVYSSYAASLKPVGLALGLAAVVLALAGHGGPSEHLWVREPLDGLGRDGPDRGARAAPDIATAGGARPSPSPARDVSAHGADTVRPALESTLSVQLRDVTLQGGPDVGSRPAPSEELAGLPDQFVL